MNESLGFLELILMIIIFADVNARKFLKKYYKMQKAGRESSGVCVCVRVLLGTNTEKKPHWTRVRRHV